MMIGKSRDPRWGWHLLPWLLCLGVAGAVLLAPAELYIQTLAADDGLYYPIVARNLVRGLGSTYDGGLTQTNGYHPLWAWVQSGVALVFGNNSGPVYLWWVKALIVATVLGSLYVWQLFIRRVFADETPVLIFLLLLGGYWWSIYTLYSGMETPLVVLMMGLLLLHAQRIGQQPTSSLADSVLLGLLMAATFLARLDSIFFIGCVALALAVRWRRPSEIRAFLVTFGVAGLAVAPYLLWNVANFGHLMPVSGLRKTPGLRLDVGWATLTDFWGNKVEKLLSLLGWPGLILLVLVGLAMLLVARRELALAVQKWGIAWALVGGALIHYLYTSLFMTEGDIDRYQYAEYLSVYLILATGGYALALWLRRMGWARLDRVLVAAVALFVVGILLFYVPGTLVNPVNAITYATGLWAKENTAPETRFGMYDSGIFHFAADRPTLAMNGLAGDEAVLTLALGRDIRGMVDQYGLDYVVTVVPARDAATLAANHLRYLSDEVAVERYYFDTARYAILASDYFRQPSGWQLADRRLCRYQAILQEGCAPER